MKRILKLQDHKHSGKLLAHHHTSYRGLVVVLVTLGLAMVLIQRVASADTTASYIVTAMLPAPISDTPAQIEHPADGITVTNPTFTVSGTCPVLVPSLIVIIYDNTSQLGSTVCDSSGRFALTVTVQSVAPRLIARIVNITGQQGPPSDPVIITYQQPVAPTPPTPKPPPVPHGTNPQTTHQTTTPSTPALHISTRTPYLIFGPTVAAEWSGVFSGGTPPYDVHIDWGDGATQTVQNVTQTTQRFSHYYTKMKAYVVKISIYDAKGVSLTRRYAAITPTTETLEPTVGSIDGGSGGISSFLGDLRPPTATLYISYLVLIGVTGVFWYQASVPKLAHVKVRPTHAKPTRKRSARMGKTNHKSRR